MSLLLNGAKTITIAGTEMQCIEIYTGEAYTFPFQFTDSVGNAINTTSWTLGTTAKFYVADTVTYTDDTNIDIGNLTLSGNTYTGGNLTAAFTTPASGIGYLYIPADLTGATGGGPVITLANSGANTNIAVVTLTVTRTNALSTPKQDISREPIGMIVRYQ
jgi:uncharacterized protein YjbI with pentapeptide repeats